MGGTPAYDRHSELENAAAGRPISTRRPGWLPPTAALIAVILAAALHGGSGAASGHERALEARNQTPQRVVRQLEISPRIGPPGTRATLRSSLLPAVTPVQLVIGGTQSGFEELALAQTNGDGELEETVEVPAWAERDRTHRFLIFNLYFSTVLAESPIFHVTDANGAVVRAGEVGSAGSECTTLEGEDGERYRLVDAADGLEIGNRLVVEGVLSESDDGCGEGLSLDLKLIAIRSIAE